jgi:aliphatic nitrilase
MDDDMIDYTGTAHVAAVQAAPVWLDLDATVEKSISLIEDASARGAELVAFPEVWLPGYPHFIWTKSNSDWPATFFQRYHENSLQRGSRQLAALQDAARKHDIAVVMGVSEREAGSLYISQTVIDEAGELRGIRRKFKPTHAERTMFGEGDGSDFKVFDMKVGRVGALSCWEHMQPLVKFTMNSLSEQIHVGSWPAISQPHVDAFGARTQDMINRMYAMENQCFVLSTSQVIDEVGQSLMADTDREREWLQVGGGLSRIYGPDGRDLAEPLAPTEEGVITADIDLSSIVAMKNALDQVGHYSKPSIFTLIVNDTPLKAVEFTSGAVGDSRGSGDAALAYELRPAANTAAELRLLAGEADTGVRSGAIGDG